MANKSYTIFKKKTIKNKIILDEFEVLLETDSYSVAAFTFHSLVNSLKKNHKLVFVVDNVRQLIILPDYYNEKDKALDKWLYNRWYNKPFVKPVDDETQNN